MRVLVIGDRGQLGSEMVSVLERNHGLAVLGIDYPDIDITDQVSTELVFGGFDPDFVINCAAFTAVDDAETNEDAALLVNGLGPRIIAQECHKASAWLVHVSTDYVFDGTATSPYGEDDPPGPSTAYGRTKLAGEVAVREVLPDAHYIIRTAWLYGRSGTNFVKTMLRLQAQHRQLEAGHARRVRGHQHGSAGGSAVQRGVHLRGRAQRRQVVGAGAAVRPRTGGADRQRGEAQAHGQGRGEGGRREGDLRGAHDEFLDGRSETGDEGQTGHGVRCAVGGGSPDVTCRR